MSRDWTPDELQAASTAMKAAGRLSYEEFCDELARHLLKLGDSFGGEPCDSIPEGTVAEFGPECDVR